MLMLALVSSMLPVTAYAKETSPHDPMPTQAFTRRDAFILGLVEGLTEFLPISSTGHLILVKTALGLDRNQPINIDHEKKQEEQLGLSLKAAVDSYIIIIQIGGIAAVLVLYWPRVRLITSGVLGRSPEGRRLGFRLSLALMPAVVFALAFETVIDRYLFSAYPVALALVIGALFMLILEHCRQSQKARPSPKRDEATLATMSVAQALLIGFCQVVALWPGMSRAMTALAGGYLIGLKPREAAEFSFLLGLPILSGAALYESVQNGPALVAALSWSSLGIGAVVAMVTAALSVKWMVGFLERYGLAPFAFYRLGLALFIFSNHLF